MSAATHEKLRRAQDLLRPSVPTGDPAEILDSALTLFVERLERAKIATVRVPRPTTRPTRVARTPSRHIPAHVKRAVWARDTGRCGFVGPQGRCTETGRLEFHHVIPFADGGPTEAANLSLRCRAHNGLEHHRWSAPQWREAGP